MRKSSLHPGSFFLYTDVAMYEVVPMTFKLCNEPYHAYRVLNWTFQASFLLLGTAPASSSSAPTTTAELATLLQGLFH
jgi:hypothetical protein